MQYIGAFGENCYVCVSESKRAGVVGLSKCDVCGLCKENNMIIGESIFADKHISPVAQYLEFLARNLHPAKVVEEAKKGITTSRVILRKYDSVGIDPWLSTLISNHPTLFTIEKRKLFVHASLHEPDLLPDLIPCDVHKKYNSIHWQTHRKSSERCRDCNQKRLKTLTDKKRINAALRNLGAV